MPARPSADNDAFIMSVKPFLNVATACVASAAPFIALKNKASTSFFTSASVCVEPSAFALLVKVAVLVNIEPVLPSSFVYCFANFGAAAFLAAVAA
jgi:hypothetical protein